MSFLDFLIEMTSSSMVFLISFGLESMMEKLKALGSLIIPDPLYLSTGQIGMDHPPSTMKLTILLDCNIQQAHGSEELPLNKLLLSVQSLCFQLLDLLELNSSILFLILKNLVNCI